MVWQWQPADFEANKGRNAAASVPDWLTAVSVSEEQKWRWQIECDNVVKVMWNENSFYELTVAKTPKNWFKGWRSKRSGIRNSFYFFSTTNCLIDCFKSCFLNVQNTYEVPQGSVLGTLRFHLLPSVISRDYIFCNDDTPTKGQVCCQFRLSKWAQIIFKFKYVNLGYVHPCMEKVHLIVVCKKERKWTFAQPTFSHRGHRVFTDISNPSL